MIAWLRNRPVVLAAGVVAAVVAAYLAFGVFGIHTAFVDDEVAEAGPVFASGAAPSGLESDAISEDTAADMTEDMADEPVEVTVDEDMPDMPAESEANDTAEAGAAAEADEAPAAPQIQTIFSGTFIDRSHPAVGRADVLTDGSTQRFLRFEDFATDNGPDLNVYLSNAAPDGDAALFDDDFIDLGDLKGNIGSQNYEIPADVDLERYRTVVIWCVRFGVAFGAAELSST